jgi:ubiquinone/menaquinone biosynthesis C-methylase UbiE
MTTPTTPTSPRDFYDREYHYEEDAARPETKRIWRSLRHLQPMNGKTFLDLGCGAGWAARMARDTGGAENVIGLDFSRTALLLARQHSPQILWLQADGTALPIADASIDRLFCNGSLEHFPDIPKGLAELARILKTGATAVLIVPNFYVRTEQPMEFRTHYWGWKNLFTAGGLRLEKTGIDWGPEIFKNANFKRAFARAIGKVISAVPFMQYQFVFVVRKS